MSLKPCYLSYDFSESMDLLREAAKNLPNVYQENLANPYIHYLENQQIENTKELTPLELDVMKCIQVCGKFPMNLKAKAVTKLINGIYQGYFKEGIPPLHLWNTISKKIYRQSVMSLKLLGIKVHIVAFPILQQSGNIADWAALAHMVSGMGLLDSNPEIIKESKEKIAQKLIEQKTPEALIQYWEDRWESVITDVIGFLNLGPGSIGLFEYIRFVRDGKFQIQGSKRDSHLLDLMRIYFAQEVLQVVDFSQYLPENTPSQIQLNGIFYPFQVVIESVECVAEHLCHMKFDALKGKSLSEIRQWNKEDQKNQSNLILDSMFNRFRNYNVEDIITDAVLKAYKQR